MCAALCHTAPTQVVYAKTEINAHNVDTTDKGPLDLVESCADRCARTNRRCWLKQNAVGSDAAVVCEGLQSSGSGSMATQCGAHMGDAFCQAPTAWYWSSVTALSSGEVTEECDPNFRDSWCAACAAEVAHAFHTPST